MTASATSDLWESFDADLAPVVQLPSASAPPISDGFRLLTIKQLRDAPPPSWLIRDVLPAGLAVLHAQPGQYKSFLALDWALSVAAGRPWLDHEPTPGWVVYIAAEGRSGIGQRVNAWLHHHQLDDVPRFRLLADTVNLTDVAQVARARAAISGLPEPPRLLVVDTLARSMPGADENSAQHVGQLIANVDSLRADQSAIVVHHDRKEGEGRTVGMRGSGALNGAADIAIQVQAGKPAGHIKIRCSKPPKDAPAWEPIRLVASPTLDSVVLLQADGPDAAENARDNHKPTFLMERVSRYIEINPGATRNQIRDDVRGKSDYVLRALSYLVTDLHVHRKPVGNRYEHYINSPYRDPGPQTGPNATPDPPAQTGPRAPTPIGGAARDPLKGPTIETHQAGPDQPENLW